MIDFLNSSAGIYLLYSLAGVFQLFGIVIVVREFLRARRNDQLLQGNLQVIWKVWNEIDEDSGPLSVEYAGGDESFAAMIRPRSKRICEYETSAWRSKASNRTQRSDEGAKQMA
ncbi:hypothetical protein ACETU7_24645 [Rhodococcus sp. 3Y1]